MNILKETKSKFTIEILIFIFARSSFVSFRIAIDLEFFTFTTVQMALNDTIIMF